MFSARHRLKGRAEGTKGEDNKEEAAKARDAETTEGDKETSC